MFNGALTDPFHIFALYAAVNALIMLVLGILVSRARVKTGIGIGDGGNPALGRSLSAHGNNTEYTPTALLLILGMATLGGPTWMLHLTGGLLTGGRILDAIGLSQNEGPSLLHLIGMVLTYLCYIVGVVALLWLAIVPGAVAS